MSSLNGMPEHHVLDYANVNVNGGATLSGKINHEIAGAYGSPVQGQANLYHYLDAPLLARAIESLATAITALTILAIMLIGAATVYLVERST